MLGLKLIMGSSVRGVLDVIVAGVSLVIGLGFWVFVTPVLRSVAFFRCAKQSFLIKELMISLTMETRFTRVVFPDRSKGARDWDPDHTNLPVDPEFAQVMFEWQYAWRRAIISRGISIPGMSSTHDRQSRLPATSIQAQRDYFGAHMYEMIDMLGGLRSPRGPKN